MGHKHSPNPGTVDRQPAGGFTGRARLNLPVHLARPFGRTPCERPGCGYVHGKNCRGTHGAWCTFIRVPGKTFPSGRAQIERCTNRGGWGREPGAVDALQELIASHLVVFTHLVAGSWPGLGGPVRRGARRPEARGAARQNVDLPEPQRKRVARRGHRSARQPPTVVPHLPVNWFPLILFDRWNHMGLESRRA